MENVNLLLSMWLLTLLMCVIASICTVTYEAHTYSHRCYVKILYIYHYLTWLISLKGVIIHVITASHIREDYSSFNSG